MKTGKNFHAVGFRFQLLGDALGVIPVLSHVEKLYPNSYKTFCLAAKSKHLAPLLIGQELIDKIFIFDGFEGPESERDFALIKSADLYIHGNPQHSIWNWHNFYNFYEETFLLSGFSIEDYNALPEDRKLPKLVKWFRPEPRPSNHGKIIGIWGFANYGGAGRRQPTQQYWTRLVEKLIGLGYGICQFGHFNDPKIYEDGPNFKRFNEIDFFHQIRMTLSTDLVLSTDSGSGLIFAAYDHPQINWVTRHSDGHIENRFSLAPLGPNAVNFSGETCCDDVPQEEVLAKILEKTKF